MKTHRETTQPKRAGALHRAGSVCVAVISAFLLHASLVRTFGLDWVDSGDYRRAALSPGTEDGAGFEAIPSGISGLAFTNRLSQARYLTNHVLLNGSGVAAGDVDGDGRCDLYFCGLDSENALFRNLGDWRFAEVADEAGVRAPELDATGAVFSDLDGDGDLDLLVNAVAGGTHLFVNDGQGRFHDQTAASGLASDSAAMSLALADIDADGDLDIYQVNYRSWTIRDVIDPDIKVGTDQDGKRGIVAFNGRPVTDPDLVGRFTLLSNGQFLENGEADVVFRNLGGCRFEKVTWTDLFRDHDDQPLAEPFYDWGLSAAFRDLNGDGAPDLYVCNDLESPDRIWINQGNGVLRLMNPLRIRHTSWFSMGVDFADLNHDGADDIFVADMASRDHHMRHTQLNHLMIDRIGQVAVDSRPQFPRNCLFVNRTDAGDYSEIAWAAGVALSDWSWQPVFLDVDLDGQEDILITTGFELNVQDLDITDRIEGIRRRRKLSPRAALGLRRQFGRLAQRNIAFRNNGNMTFSEHGSQWGFDALGVSHAMALADLDNDGDLDIAVNNLNDAATLYQNIGSRPRVAVRLRSDQGNTDGIGGRIRFQGGAPWVQSQEIMSGGRYLSGDQAQRVFAVASPSDAPMRLEVHWPGGKILTVENVAANTLYEISQPREPTVTSAIPMEGFSQLLFNDISAQLSHTHQDDAVDGFRRQPLQPRSLSRLGPGVLWLDLNQDGWEDLVVGAGRGGSPAVFVNDTRGSFLPQTVAGEAGLHTSGMAGTLLGPERRAVWFAGTVNDKRLGQTLSVTPFHFKNGRTERPETGLDVPETDSATGPIALGDLDRDGDLDLFLGGRWRQGMYPLPASSALFLYESADGTWVRDQTGGGLLEGAGMVSGAVMSDLDQDGWPELILACEWGSLRIFKYDAGRLEETTRAWRLDSYRGFWNGIETGDFDGDGRLDIAAANWGRNSYHALRGRQPWKLYYGDWTGQNRVDMLESYFDDPLGKWVPRVYLSYLRSVLPALTQRFPSHESFAAAGVEDLLGALAERSGVVAVNWLESTVFLNRGDHFEARPLPAEAQWSPAYAVCAGDLNGDGSEDLFLSQNFFGTDPMSARQDAGFGLCLLGDGGGKFNALSPSESGVLVTGEQRGAALADFDHDGRVDLVVTQNNAATRLFRNASASPGLRVKLRGPDRNPLGIGAQLRLVYGERFGPLREVHAGSGYWSQGATTQVMGPVGPSLTGVEVRWPGGTTKRYRVPPRSREIVVEPSGAIRSEPEI